MFEIQDSSGNNPFDRSFLDSDDAEEFLCNYFDAQNMDYKEFRHEFYIVEY